MAVPPPVDHRTVTVCVLAVLKVTVNRASVVAPAPPSATGAGSAIDRAGAGSSSSVRSNCAPVTVKPVNVPPTVTVVLLSSVSSFSGVNVNVPCPLDCPAAIVTSNGVTAV